MGGPGSVAEHEWCLYGVVIPLHLAWMDSDDDQSTANLFLLCRYLMYIEADAWATNLKQKLACGSVLMSAKMEYYEFFTRALLPNVHYVEVSTSDMCQDTASKVTAGASFHIHALDAHLQQ